jgi:hypothetical protein
MDVVLHVRQSGTAMQTYTADALFELLGERPQRVVPAGWFQATRSAALCGSTSSYTLFGCTVSPGLGVCRLRDAVARRAAPPLSAARRHHRRTGLRVIEVLFSTRLQ